MGAEVELRALFIPRPTPYSRPSCFSCLCVPGTTVRSLAASEDLALRGWDHWARPCGVHGQVTPLVRLSLCPLRVASTYINPRPSFQISLILEEKGKRIMRRIRSLSLTFLVLIL